MKTVPFPLNTDLSWRDAFLRDSSDNNTNSTPWGGRCLEFFLFEDSEAGTSAGALGEYANDTTYSSSRDAINNAGKDF